MRGVERQPNSKYLYAASAPTGVGEETDVKSLRQLVAQAWAFRRQAADIGDGGMGWPTKSDGQPPAAAMVDISPANALDGVGRLEAGFSNGALWLKATYRDAAEWMIIRRPDQVGEGTAYERRVSLQDLKENGEAWFLNDLIGRARAEWFEAHPSELPWGPGRPSHGSVPCDGWHRGPGGWTPPGPGDYGPWGYSRT